MVRAAFRAPAERGYLAGVTLDDRPQPLGSCWNYWFCVAGGDQAGIMAALGLTDPQPTTYALAREEMDRASHGSDTGLVCVTGEINGWTAVVGPWCDPTDKERHEEVRTLVEVLSAQYGEAHAFYFGAQRDGSAWLVARDGRTIRRYSDLSSEMALGDPLPVEQRYLDQFDIPGRPEDHLDDEDMSDDMFEFWHACTAQRVAQTISLDVVWHMPTDAVVCGQLVLARVPERARGAQRGHNGV
ncbi:hypothetical protein GCM10009679_73920 [Saccharothrix algeriensis]|uniref:Uncharacterized protein n=2 Tax=Catellatospora bangladeshensis TaxID=310355 RepID=A0A8J3JK22_9ACTN|nr:hypothetical protein Cba03nite_76160 [Catellatospora bangladeshensis]